MSGKKKKTPSKAQKNKIARQAKQVTVEIDGDRLSGVPKLLVILAMVLITVACWVLGIRADGVPHAVGVRDVPAYTGSAYAVINDNRPLFTEEEIYTRSYEYYAPLDELERCVYAMACLGKDLMPPENGASSARCGLRAGCRRSMRVWTAEICITAAI